VAEAGRGQPLPRLAFPPDFYAPDSGSWDRRYPRSTESFRAHQAMMQPIRAMIALVENSSLVYRLTGEEPCREPARQAMNALAALDLTATSYHNTHAFHCLIPTLAVGLDYLWEELEPSERETIVSALTARAREFHPLSVQVALRDPLNSHAISYGPLHSDLADGDHNVMLQFKSSHFGSFNHSHADQNSFVLEAFRHPLLIDSGYYPWYGSPHDLTWTRQTRAHNALLINGKGQGVWNRAAAGHIVAFVSTADFDYTAGDATAAYQQPSLYGAPEELCAAAEGVVRVVRHIVFARPHVFVILDEVETEQPAAIQFLLHALHPFQIDASPEVGEPGGRASPRVVTIANGPALARIHLLEPGPVEISQTDQFSAPPENGSPNQWHLTCAFAPTPEDGRPPRAAPTSCRRLLTVIVVGRSGETLPAVERLESPGKIGTRIGDTAVQFRTGNGHCSAGCQPAGRQDVGATVGDFAVPRPVVGVTCCGVRADGTRTWLEYSGPFAA
jgi:hypothetical protein